MVTFLSRVSTEQVAGFGSSVKHPVSRVLMTPYLKNLLEALRAKAENNSAVLAQAMTNPDVPDWDIQLTSQFSEPDALARSSIVLPHPPQQNQGNRISNCPISVVDSKAEHCRQFGKGFHVFGEIKERCEGPFKFVVTGNKVEHALSPFIHGA